MTTILVVEDDAAVASLITTILEDDGYKVVAARDGREALAMLSQTQTDLVLSDIMMPVLDGFALCRAMQAEVAYRSLPLVLMSAVEKVPEPSDCRCAAFLRKPFDPTALLSLVARVTGSGDQSASLV